ncbi:hypothetical protein BD413DRAFT_675086 [Trametes elegans]|nr:hypothetical protein BD413DRAFT_675086 [Trametes elegans]
MMFGRGKFQYGILVNLTDEEAIDPPMPKRQRVRSPALAHLQGGDPRGLSLPAVPAQRQGGVILKDDQGGIDRLYDAVEQGAQSDLQPPAVWDAPNTLTFFRAVVEHTLRRSVSDDADISGVAATGHLQATWIRNTILRAIRDSDPSAVKRLPVNLVFKAPTISALTNIIHAVMNDVDADANVSDTPHDLWKYVEKYSANFPSRPTDLVDRPHTTGGFGCDALEHLRDDSIERVYAFNRKDSDAVARQHAQFRARG